MEPLTITTTGTIHTTSAQLMVYPAIGAQHGTHVMGTMVGDDGGANQIGMAPGAKWISCKGGDSVSGYLLTNELLTCAQWILAPFDLNGAESRPGYAPERG